MTCRQFEDAMRSEFGSVDREESKGRITRENWDGLPPSEHIGARQRTRACFINALQPGRRGPQGLKPSFLLTDRGTAEAVPYPKPILETRSRPPVVIASPESMISAAFLQNHPKG
jgi:hypothetical protein